MPNYYEFGREADRLIAVQLTHLGELGLTIRKRGAAGWVTDLEVPLAAMNKPFSFVAGAVPNGAPPNAALVSLQASGWNPPIYPVDAAFTTGAPWQWPFRVNGAHEFNPGNPAANVKNRDTIEFGFTPGHGTSQLVCNNPNGWRATLTLMPQVPTQFVVVRVFDPNKGFVEFNGATPGGKARHER